MSEGRNQKWIASRAWALLLGLTLVLPGLASISAAQSQGAKAAPAVTKAAPAAQKTASGDKGLNTGIKVHGHWVIEVKNRDGSVARHVEFENSLDPGFSGFDPNGPPLNFPGGAAYLAGILTGSAVQPAGLTNGLSGVNPTSDWEIVLEGGVGLTNLQVTGAGSPCITSQPYPEISYSQNLGAPVLAFANQGVGACLVAQQSSIFCPTGVGQPAGISCNLSVGSATAPSGAPAIQLSGNVAATQNGGQISTVATFIGLPCGLPNDPNTGRPYTIYGNVPLYLGGSSDGCFIGTAPTNQNTFQAALASFTSNGNFPGAPVMVSSGQIIVVTVTISFQ